MKTSLSYNRLFLCAFFKKRSLLIPSVVEGGGVGGHHSIQSDGVPSKVLGSAAMKINTAKPLRQRTYKMSLSNTKQTQLRQNEHIIISLYVHAMRGHHHLWSNYKCNALRS